VAAIERPRLHLAGRYGRQANDETLVRLAMRIQARAIRKAGELLQQISNAAGRPGKSQQIQEDSLQNFGRTKVARDAGFSEHQQKQALRVANIPACE
jgi:hypothetical protein